MRLLESCLAQLTPAADCPEGVVPNVKILGLKSRQNRRYLESAVRAAVPLYEGAPVYFDHDEAAAIQGKARPFIHKFGCFKNVRFVPGDGLRGDFHYNPAHLYADTFRGWLKSDPNEIGFSHDADGKTRSDPATGEVLVEALVRVRSVDLVSSPATTQGLFESMPDTFPDLGADMDAMDSGATTTPVAEEAPALEAGTPGYEEQLGTLVATIVNDPALSVADKRKKVLAALKLLDDTAAPATEATPEPSESEERTEEAIGATVARLADRLMEVMTARLGTVTAIKPVRESAAPAPRAPVALAPTGGKQPDLTVDQLVAGLKSR